MDVCVTGGQSSSLWPCCDASRTDSVTRKEGTHPGAPALSQRLVYVLSKNHRSLEQGQQSQPKDVDGQSSCCVVHHVRASGWDANHGKGLLPEYIVQPRTLTI